ncbi:hypothetical protein COBT_002511 [Conglomerata obtusa]
MPFYDKICYLCFYIAALKGFEHAIYDFYIKGFNYNSLNQSIISQIVNQNEKQVEETTYKSNVKTNISQNSTKLCTKTITKNHEIFKYNIKWYPLTKLDFSCLENFDVVMKTNLEEDMKLKITTYVFFENEYLHVTKQRYMKNIKQRLISFLKKKKYDKIIDCLRNLFKYRIRKTPHPYDSSHMLAYDDSITNKKILSYVNASLIPIYGNKFFIAAQHPKLQYVVDFYNLLLSYNCTTIVALIDHKKENIADYIARSNKKATIFTTYETQKIELCNTQITRYLYKKCKNLQSPKKEEFYNFYIDFLEQFDTFSQNIIVHGQQGIGRTGLFMAYHILGSIYSNYDNHDAIENNGCKYPQKDYKPAVKDLYLDIEPVNSTNNKSIDNFKLIDPCETVDISHNSKDFSIIKNFQSYDDFIAESNQIKRLRYDDEESLRHISKHKHNKEQPKTDKQFLKTEESVSHNYFDFNQNTDDMIKTANFIIDKDAVLIDIILYLRSYRNHLIYTAEQIQFLHEVFC